MEDWRRIDIDQFDGDHLTKEELIPELPETTQAQASQISQQVKSALSSGQFAEALALVLENPPYNAHESVKSAYADTVFEALISIKNNKSDLTGIVKQLSPSQQDNLIKYLYKNMSTPYGAKQGGLLLNWYEKTIEVTGLGPVVRFMSDRRTV